MWFFEHMMGLIEKGTVQMHNY